MAGSSKNKQKTSDAVNAAEASQSALPAVSEIVGHALSASVLADMITPEDVYVSPEVLAAMTGLDEKWFAGARQGEKEVDGPPFIKLGTSKSSPVRYNLGDVRKWWAQFPKRVTTHGKVSTFRSAGEFFKAASPDSRWLFAEVEGAPVDIVLAIQSGAFGGVREPRVEWLTFPEWIERAWRSERLHREVSALLRPIQVAALANHEQASFEVEVRKVPDAERRRIDDLAASGAQAEDEVVRQVPPTNRRL